MTALNNLKQGAHAHALNTAEGALGSPQPATCTDEEAARSRDALFAAFDGAPPGKCPCVT
jgi:hypothetical protein